MCRTEEPLYEYSVRKVCSRFTARLAAEKVTRWTKVGRRTAVIFDHEHIVLDYGMIVLDHISKLRLALIMWCRNDNAIESSI